MERLTAASVAESRSKATLGLSLANALFTSASSPMSVTESSNPRSLAEISVLHAASKTGRADCKSRIASRSMASRSKSSWSRLERRVKEGPSENWRATAARVANAPMPATATVVRSASTGRSMPASSGGTHTAGWRYACRHQQGTSACATPDRGRSSVYGTRRPPVTWALLLCPEARPLSRQAEARRHRTQHTLHASVGCATFPAMSSGRTARVRSTPPHGNGAEPIAETRCRAVQHSGARTGAQQEAPVEARAHGRLRPTSINTDR